VLRAYLSDNGFDVNCERDRVTPVRFEGECGDRGADFVGCRNAEYQQQREASQQECQ
jgi:hypothetical protein